MKSKPEFKTLTVDQLSRGHYQPRREFEEEALRELAESIQAAGLIQPIVVRPRGGAYEIVAGERRWRAAQLAGMQEVPCLVNNYTDEQTAAVTTIENINRVDLNPIEEAQAYQRLIDDFGYIHEEIAAVVGKSRAKVTNSLRLLKLEVRVRQFLVERKLSEGHGKILAGLPANLQFELARKAIVRGWNVRKIEQESRKAQSETPSETNKKDINIRALEAALTRHVGCKVSIDSEEEKGQLKIDFHDLDILEGIFEKMGFKFND
jgi:ParB family chromosome partitioning protein